MGPDRVIRCDPGNHTKRKYNLISASPPPSAEGAFSARIKGFLKTHMTPDLTPPAAPLAEPILEWEAPSIPHHERSPRWYAVAGITVLVMAAYAIVTGSWTFAVVVLLSAGMYFLLRREKPASKAISILPQGVNLDGRFYAWGDLESFWLIPTPGYTELHIAQKSRSVLIVQTGAVPTDVVRAALSQFIREDSDRHESLLDIFIRICKL